MANRPARKTASRAASEHMGAIQTRVKEIADALMVLVKRLRELPGRKEILS